LVAVCSRDVKDGDPAGRILFAQVAASPRAAEHEAMALPAPLVPRLATAGQPPAGEGSAFEWKWDGVRAVVAVDGGQVAAWSRTGRDIIPSYPELATLLDLVDRLILLDGELVTHDEQGRPNFGRLQSRMHVRHPGVRLLAEYPVAFYVFDLLHLDGTDLTHILYEDRRGQLDDLDLDTPPACGCPSVTPVSPVPSCSRSRGRAAWRALSPSAWTARTSPVPDPGTGSKPRCEKPKRSSSAAGHRAKDAAPAQGKRRFLVKGERVRGISGRQTDHRVGVAESRGGYVSDSLCAGR
jgi:hypothetical protein